MTTEEVKITRWTCDHVPLPPHESGTIERWLKKPSTIVADPHTAGKRESEEVDWEFAVKYLGKRIVSAAVATYPKHLEAMGICWECSDILPSEVTRRLLQYQAMKATSLASELQEYLARVESGDPFYFCSGCNEFKEPEDLVELRECPHCEKVFNGSDGPNCPSCNRPFTRNLEVEGCSDCLDADNPPEPASAELIKDMMEASA